MSCRKGRTIIAGHSQAVCLGMPLRSSNSMPEVVSIDALFDALTGKLPRNDVYWEKLASLAPDRAVAIFWNGNQHYGRFTLAEKPAFDLVLPDEPHRPIQSKAVIVPVLRVKKYWLPTFSELAPILETLKHCKGCRPFLVGSPPPVRNDECILAALARKDKIFLNLSTHNNIDLDTAKLTPRSVMYKLWATIQSSAKDVADAHQIPFLSVPSAARASDGFLRDEYSQSIDFTHANSSYGALMRDHIDAFVTEWK